MEMGNFIDSILGLQKKKEKKIRRKDGAIENRKSLICFHNIDWNLSDFFKFLH
ncbi:hypothetical protein [Lactobacillus crispatus]|uniref:hypothetical protein n=1 Tax=Lactobacillus crispatus TaxID=47770 RepID=UPI0022E7B7F9|nr:hypothetical protein [Lactobacillus crispatus]